MAESPQRFAELLTRAIRQIKRAENNKPISVIQDELGYALGREGGSAVEHWRKGNLPPGRQDVEMLARHLTRRGQLDQAWLKDFLESGGCGASLPTLMTHLFAASQPSPSPEPLAATATAASSIVPFQAPPRPPHFVGRATALQQIANYLLTENAPRIVALVGMAGAGKTALATQAAHQWRTHWPHGILWGHTTTSAPLDILNSWASAFGYDYRGLHDVESCAAALRSVFRDKALLFILDDVTSVQAVRPLLIGGEHSAVLHTTRSMDVAMALGSTPISLAELAPSEGVELLTKLLGVQRVNAAAEAAAAICQAVHQLPLAVEIVGQLLAARPRRALAQMAQRLQDLHYRLDLQISDRDVRTSFLVSWEALNKQQQRIFAHLALFQGRAFTLAALAAVLDEEAEAVLEDLDLLVARSLVKASEGERYQQHLLLADFAREQLGNAPVAWQRFAESQFAFAKAHSTRPAALEPEWENLMAGMAAAAEQQAWAMVLAYADTLAEPWLAQARYRDACQGYTLAVTGATQRQNQAALARYLIQLGFIWCELSDFAKATPCLEQAQAVAAAAQLPQLQADAHYHRARIALEQGAYEACDAHLRQCETRQNAAEDRIGTAKALHLRGILAQRVGDHTKAQQLGEQALRLQEAAHDIPGLLGTHYLLADCALKAGHYALSEMYGKRSLQILATHPRKAELAETYFSLAMTYRYQEKPQQAWSALEQSRALAEHMGSRAFLSYILYEQSRIQFQFGEIEQALHSGLTSLAVMQELADKFNQVICLRYLGDLYHHQGNAAQARQRWQEGEAIALDLQHPEIHLIRQRLGKAAP
ncbi:MAG: tetratricopeptide repeat protein [Caldilineaceae bacterium]|nr:tetratricopeptide repeat protein [Caldilineaceae bacterium]